MNKYNSVATVDEQAHDLSDGGEEHSTGGVTPSTLSKCKNFLRCEVSIRSS